MCVGMGEVWVVVLGFARAKQLLLVGWRARTCGWPAGFDGRDGYELMAWFAARDDRKVMDIEQERGMMMRGVGKKPSRDKNMLQAGEHLRLRCFEYTRLA